MDGETTLKEAGLFPQDTVFVQANRWVSLLQSSNLYLLSRDSLFPAAAVILINVLTYLSSYCVPHSTQTASHPSLILPLTVCVCVCVDKRWK